MLLVVTLGTISTVLHVAAREGQLQITQQLLNTGTVDVNSADSEAALYLASRYGHEQVVQCVLVAR